nr:unnamed protein product [Callosobruchus chinensis]
MFVPLKRYKTSTYPCRFSSELKNTITCKKIAHKRFKLSGSLLHYEYFVQLRDKCATLKDVCYDRYIKKLEADISVNSKSFWKHVDAKKKCYTLPTEMFYVNESSSDIQGITDLFARYFASVFSNEDVNQIPEFKYSRQVDVNSYTVDVKTIIDMLSFLGDKLIHGPDGIPLFFIKKCSFTLCKPLERLYNMSLSTGVFPDLWKESYLKPIYKNGSRSDIKNYRAVCNQSEFAKLFDCIVNNLLSWDTKGVIINQQHGFSKGKSTATNLLVYQNFIIQAFENRLQVDTIYTDFTKAFDKVNHKLLIAKLRALGIEGSVLNWISSYLAGRIQYVKCGNVVSPPIAVTSGVPQGSHLGPLLFNCFINDILDVISDSNVLLFADDLKLYNCVKDIESAQKLQYDLDNFVRWCDINLDKCYKISFFRINKPLDFHYKIKNVDVVGKDRINDLGVIFDSKMTFSFHISGIASKALKILGFVQRNSKDFSVFAFQLLYCSLVRSILEYNSVIWSPHNVGAADSLERVQKKFLRTCAFKMGNYANYDYDQLMSAINISTLCHRRMEFDLMFLYKIVNSIVNCPELLGFIKFNINDKRTRITELFAVPFYHTNYGQNEALTRFLKTANRFSTQVELFDSSLPKFRRVIRNL